MIRKLLSIMLCLCVLLSFAACDGTESGSGTEESSASSGTETVSTVSTDSAVDSEKPSDTSDKPASKYLDTVDEVFAASEHFVGLCDQGNSRIIVCDIEEEDWTDDNAVVWEFKDKTCSSAAGIKFRDNDFWGGEVLVYCYHGGAAIVSYKTRKMLYHTTNTGGNPHSVELLPNGCLVVASSTDNDVRIYAPESRNPSDTVSFPNAHGVLWDPENEVLWLEGKNEVAAYKVGGDEDHPTLAPIGGMNYKTPKSGLHDMAPMYGDSNKLFVTCGAGIMVFDKTEETFSYGYKGGSVGRLHGYAPGCGQFEQDDVFVFTTIKDTTKVLNDWCTNQVWIYVPLSNGLGKTIIRKAPDDAYYKIRVLNFDYQ